MTFCVPEIKILEFNFAGLNAVPLARKGYLAKIQKRTVGEEHYCQYYQSHRRIDARQVDRPFGAPPDDACHITDSKQGQDEPDDECPAAFNGPAVLTQPQYQSVQAERRDNRHDTQTREDYPMNDR